MVVSDTPSQSQHATEDPDLEKEGSISDDTSISEFQKDKTTILYAFGIIYDRYLAYLEGIIIYIAVSRYMGL